MPFSMDGNHVCSIDFNIIADQEQFFYAYIDYFKNKRIPKDLDGFTIEILLLEAYHDIYRIIDLDNEDVPIPLLQFTNADTVGEIGPLSDKIVSYKTFELNEKFNLSISEYLDLPIHIAEAICQIAKAEKELEKQIADNIK